MFQGFGVYITCRSNSSSLQLAPNLLKLISSLAICIDYIEPPEFPIPQLAMASSSSAVTTSFSNKGYDVFINHRGPDTKRTFSSHLYHRLLSHGLRPFLDQQELQEGLNFPSQIQETIASASVHVAIFSPHYAESPWVLNELVLMLQSRAVILPVFYHVSPSELQRTKGKDGIYAQALRRLEMKTRYDSQTGETKPRYDFSVIEEWRNALIHVSSISGFELDLCNGDEADLLDKVVQRVLQFARKPSLDVAKYPTGLDEKVKDFEIKVLSGKQSGKPQVVGIVGLGGVGKTTLAKELFNRKRSSFSRSCFLSDVRDTAGRNSLHFLLSKLLKDLTNLDIQVYSVTEGTELFKKHVSSNYGDNAIVILDDVDGVDQLNALLSVKSYLSSNSLILITCRDKDVLIRSGVEDSSIYKLSSLSSQHSLELFCKYAFGQPHPPPGFEDLVDKFLGVCNGLPLSLKVLGALLCGQNRSYWENQLDKLQHIVLPLAKHPSVLDGKVKDFQDKVLLQHQSEKLQVAGIVGLDGVGKTTLAKKIFEMEKSSYSKSCILYDVRMSSLRSLLSKLLKGLTKLDRQVESVDEVIDLVKEHVAFSRALVILDNVDHRDQLHALLSVLTVLPSGSLILITSPDKDVLKRSGVQESSIYELSSLNRQDSLQLFCTHAFGQPSPLPGFEGLVDEFVTACNGLPLTLKMFGALHRGKSNTSYWQDKLDRLQQSPDDIKKKLEISYDALTIEEQQIFLHIACSCIGENRDLVVRLWDVPGSRGSLGFESLQKRCLVEVNGEDCIIMHEQLRDLGRTIVDERGLRRPLWPPTENNPDLLQQPSNEQVITELRRNIEDLLQESSVIREVRRFMIMILIMMIILLMMIMAMMIWSMELGREQN